MAHAKKELTLDFERALRALDLPSLSMILPGWERLDDGKTQVRYVNQEYWQLITIIGRPKRGIELHMRHCNDECELVNGRLYKHIRTLLLKEGIERVYIQPDMED